MVHNTAVTKQWTAKCSNIANAVYRIVQNHGEQSYFVGFKGAIAPLDPPLGMTRPRVEPSLPASVARAQINLAGRP